MRIENKPHIRKDFGLWFVTVRNKNGYLTEYNTQYFKKSLWIAASLGESCGLATEENVRYRYNHFIMSIRR